MQKQQSIKINMIMNAILTMSSFLFPLITFPYISRVILPVGSGKITFATSVVTYFSMFAQLGIPTYGVKACAKVRNNKEELSRIAHEILFINLIMCVLAYVVLFISISLVPKFQEEKTLIVMISSTILLTAIGVEWLYKALEQYTYITIRSIVFKFIALIAMFILVHKQSDYVIYGGITIFASSASNLLNFINLRKIIILKPVGGYNLKRHMKLILIFFAMSVATTVYTNLDNVMLGFMKTNEDVGYYSAAVKIKNLAVSVVTSASTVLLPRASYYVDHGLMKEFYKIVKKTMNCIILMAVPTAVYFILFAKEGILLLSGEAFMGAVLPMQIIMPTLIFMGITNVLGIQMMIPLGMEKQVLYSEIAGAVVDLLINLCLIPKMASAGAAIGTLGAEIVVFIWQYTVLKTVAKNTFSDTRWILIGIAVILGSVGAVWVKILKIPNLIILLLSAVLFFGIYGVVLLIGKEQLTIEIVGQCLNKVRRDR